MASDLRDGGDYLVLERDVGDPFIVFCDSQIPQIWRKAEPREQLLLDGQAEITIESRRQEDIRAVAGLAVVRELERHRRTTGKRLREAGIYRRGIQLQ